MAAVKILLMLITLTSAEDSIVPGDPIGSNGPAGPVVVERNNLSTMTPGSAGPAAPSDNLTSTADATSPPVPLALSTEPPGGEASTGSLKNGGSSFASDKAGSSGPPQANEEVATPNQSSSSIGSNAPPNFSQVFGHTKQLQLIKEFQLKVGQLSNEIECHDLCRIHVCNPISKNSDAINYCQKMICVNRICTKFSHQRCLDSMARRMRYKDHDVASCVNACGCLSPVALSPKKKPPKQGSFAPSGGAGNPSGPRDASSTSDGIEKSKKIEQKEETKGIEPETASPKSKKIKAESSPEDDEPPKSHQSFTMAPPPTPPPAFGEMNEMATMGSAPAAPPAPEAPTMVMNSQIDNMQQQATMAPFEASPDLNIHVDAHKPHNIHNVLQVHEAHNAHPAMLDSKIGKHGAHKPHDIVVTPLDSQTVLKASEIQVPTLENIGQSGISRTALQAESVALIPSALSNHSHVDTNESIQLSPSQKLMEPNVGLLPPHSPHRPPRRQSKKQNMLMEPPFKPTLQLATEVPLPEATEFVSSFNGIETVTIRFERSESPPEPVDQGVTRERAHRLHNRFVPGSKIRSVGAQAATGAGSEDHEGSVDVPVFDEDDTILDYNKPPKAVPQPIFNTETLNYEHEKLQDFIQGQALVAPLPIRRKRSVDLNEATENSYTFCDGRVTTPFEAVVCKRDCTQRCSALPSVDMKCREECTLVICSRLDVNNKVAWQSCEQRCKFACFAEKQLHNNREGNGEPLTLESCKNYVGYLSTLYEAYGGTDHQQSLLDIYCKA